MWVQVVSEDPQFFFTVKCWDFRGFSEENEMTWKKSLH